MEKLFIVAKMLMITWGVRCGKTGGAGWVWVGSIGFAGQTGRESKRAIFKRVNWVAGQTGRRLSRVELTHIFHFFFF